MTGPAALVIGAGRGIDRACAEAFSAAGRRVTAGARDPVAAEVAIGAPRGLRVVSLDVTDADAVLASPLHARGEPVRRGRDPGRAAGMRVAGAAVVVNISSIGARIANPLLGMSHASRYALSALSEALAAEARPFGIRVVSVEPGMVDSDDAALLARARAAHDDEGIQRVLSEFLPLDGWKSSGREPDGGHGWPE